LEKPEGRDCTRVPKYPAFLSIITARKWIDRRFCKVDSTGILFQNVGLPERERNTSESSVTARHSHPRESSSL
jgi:hypothetical protein